MSILFGLVVFGVILVMMMSGDSSSSGGGGSTSLGSGSRLDHYTLLKQGVVAQGILVQVSGQRSCQGSASQGWYEVRTVTVEVEVPGQKPYSISGPLSIPLNVARAVLPGATVELRVDPSYPNNLAVFGPGVGLAASSFAAPRT